MRHSGLLVLLVLAGCDLLTAEPCDVGAEESDTGLLELGRVEGVVRRSADYTGDGIGNLIVVAFFATTPSEDHFPINGLVELNVDWTNPEHEVRFTVQNLFPEPEPYYFLAVFDEDDSVYESYSWQPTSGDLTSGPIGTGEGQAYWVESGDVLNIELDLSRVEP